jgi:hypothetical protein
MHEALACFDGSLCDEEPLDEPMAECRQRLGWCSTWSRHSGSAPTTEDCDDRVGPADNRCQPCLEEADQLQAPEQDRSLIARQADIMSDAAEPGRRVRYNADLSCHVTHLIIVVRDIQHLTARFAVNGIWLVAL